MTDKVDISSQDPGKQPCADAQERSPKFRRKQLVRHLKTDGVYRIIHTPATCRLEATNEPAYAYQAVWIVSSRGGAIDLTDKPLWVRCQAEMEDGRFDLFLPLSGFPDGGEAVHSPADREGSRDDLKSLPTQTKD